MTHSLPTLETATDPLLLADLAGGIAWSNHAAKLLTGLPQGPRRLEDFLTPEAVREVVSTKVPRTFAAQLTTPTVADVPWSCTVIELTSGSPDGSILLVCLSASTPDSARLREREEFLATIAHDLKNPIGAIFGYADALLDTSAGSGLTEKQREIINRMRQTAVRSLELVRNFQHLAQFKNAHAAPPSTAIDLNAALRAVVDSVWRPSGSTLTFDLQVSPAPLPVRIERMQLERVISNLVTNAVKYTPSNGSITIVTRDEAGGALLSVQNSGSVIPAEELSNVFNQYTRASTGLSKQGTGLGLYIVKTIVEAAGGSVQAESSIQDGTRFTIRLPK